VPKRAHDYLRSEEVVPLLQALAPRWRPLFATAIYTGLRKGELLGLRKSDVDLAARQVAVARSYDHETTKSGRARVVPIASELVPYLETAIALSPSPLLFPADDGSMMRPDVALESVLRRAMGRAGIVTGWQHVCRRKGCRHREAAPNAALRRCPGDGRKLWLKPEVRRLRFHDLRHGTASLPMMAGANPAAVQRILGHSNPAITTGVYGHLAPNYLLAEVDRLAFGVEPPAIVERPNATNHVANLPPFVPELPRRQERARIQRK
jgi:integrase